MGDTPNDAKVAGDEDIIKDERQIEKSQQSSAQPNEPDGTTEKKLRWKTKEKLELNLDGRITLRTIGRIDCDPQSIRGPSSPGRRIEQRSTQRK